MAGSRGGDDVERFTAAWDEFVLAIRRSQARLRPAEDDLTLAQFYLLAPLAAGGSVSICALADHAGLAPPTVTRLVDGLERQGLLTRERSAEDRRTVLVALTEPGQERYIRKRRQIAARRRRLYERLEPDERVGSERLLRHLAEIIGGL